MDFHQDDERIDPVGVMIIVVSFGIFWLAIGIGLGRFVM
jgi:hypothetical protein